MGQKDLAEALAGHADRLNGATAATVTDSSGGGSERESAELSHLTARMRLALGPVRAPAAYRHKLERDLSEVARRRMQGQLQVAEPASPPAWIIGAAVALVGGIAYLLRSRSHSDHDLSTTPRQQSA